MPPSQDSRPTLRYFSGVFPELLHRTWEQETFLFNPRSGDTHILNALSWQLLRFCAEGPHNETVLEQAFTGWLAEIDDGPPTRAEQSLLLDQHLDELYRLGLVQCEGLP